MMRLLCFIALSAFVAVSMAQHPATVLELMSGNADFQVRYRSNNLPEWYLNGRVYYVLGSLPCNNGDNPVWNGTDWTCGNFTGFPGGQSTFEKLQCAAGQSVAFNGTTYVCADDSDLLHQLTCANGQILVKSGSTFVCAQDSDVLAGITCAEGDILVSNGSAFSCQAQTNRDTLRDLNCTEGQTVKYISGAWRCAVDLNVFNLLVCASGQVAKWDGAAFVCGTDNDYLANVPCAIGQTLVATSSTTFVCQSQPTPAGVPVSFIDGQTFPPQAPDTVFQTYFGSPITRDLNGLLFINGLQVFSFSVNFGTNPRASDPNFAFKVQFYRRPQGGTPQFLQEFPFPASVPNTRPYFLSDVNLMFNRTEELSIRYVMTNANAISVTTVLFIRHFVF